MWAFCLQKGKRKRKRIKRIKGILWVTWLVTWVGDKRKHHSKRLQTNSVFPHAGVTRVVFSDTLIFPRLPTHCVAAESREQRLRIETSATTCATWPCLVYNDNEDCLHFHYFSSFDWVESLITDDQKRKHHSIGIWSTLASAETILDARCPGLQCDMLILLQQSGSAPQQLNSHSCGLCDLTTSKNYSVWEIW